MSQQFDKFASLTLEVWEAAKTEANQPKCKERRRKAHHKINKACAVRVAATMRIAKTAMVIWKP